MFFFAKLAKRKSTALPGQYSIKVQQGYFVVTHHNGTQVYLRQRSAYPGTYCHPLEDGGVVLGYGSPHPSSDTQSEFLQLKLSASGEFSVQRDVYITLPLFYADLENGVVISNDYASIVAAAPQLTLNTQRLPRTLIQDKDTSQTLWEEIKVLGERQVLSFQHRTLHVTMPSPRPWQMSQDVPETNPHEFKTTLESAYEDFYARCLAGQRYTFELSGGLDSATLPLYLRRTRPNEPFTTISLRYPGANGEGQMTKLDALQEFLHANRHIVDLDPATHFPLARFIRTGQYTPFNVYDMIYTEANRDIARTLQSHGIHVVVTGVGGDDICENIVKPEDNYLIGSQHAERLVQSTPPFYTQKFITDFMDSHRADTTPPLTLLSTSTHLVHISRTNIYIEHDIWPVSPLANVELYTYCQGLPAFMRANKNIFRAYHQANAFPEAVYNPKHNEGFGDFLHSVFTQGNYNQIAQELIDNSYTLNKGYISKSRLLHFLGSLNNTPGTDQRVFYMYLWLCAEINIGLARLSGTLQIPKDN